MSVSWLAQPLQLGEFKVGGTLRLWVLVTLCSKYV